MSATEEGMSGHHAAYTLAIGDESSGLKDSAYSAMQGWAKRFLFFGNANDTLQYSRRTMDARINPVVEHGEIKPGRQLVAV